MKTFIINYYEFDIENISITHYISNMIGKSINEIKKSFSNIAYMISENSKGELEIFYKK